MKRIVYLLLVLSMVLSLVGAGCGGPAATATVKPAEPTKAPVAPPRRPPRPPRSRAHQGAGRSYRGPYQGA